MQKINESCKMSHVNESLKMTHVAPSSFPIPMTGYYPVGNVYSGISVGHFSLKVYDSWTIQSYEGG